MDIGTKHTGMMITRTSEEGRGRADSASRTQAYGSKHRLFQKTVVTRIQLLRTPVSPTQNPSRRCRLSPDGRELSGLCLEATPIRRVAVFGTGYEQGEPPPTGASLRPHHRSRDDGVICGTTC